MLGLVELSRRPRTKRQPSGKIVYLTARDIEIFKLLNRYRYLRSHFITTFFGKNDKTGLLKRLGALYHERPHYVQRPVRQYMYANALHLAAVYELDDAGRQALRNEGVVPLMADMQAGSFGEARNFAHALMICDILVSIELGCRGYTQHSDPGMGSTVTFNSIRFVTWEEILAKAPCKDFEHPFRIPVTLEGKQMNITPDGLFGLEYKTETGHGVVGERRFRFFALEADRATMPVFRTNLQQSSYRKKLLAYREILSKEIYKKHFGIPNLFVLNVTTSYDRMENMKVRLKEMTGGKGNTVMLFKIMKGDVFKAPPSDDHMLTDLWERAGYPPFDITHP